MGQEAQSVARVSYGAGSQLSTALSLKRLSQGPLSTAPSSLSQATFVDSLTQDRQPAEIVRVVNKAGAVLTVNDFVSMRPMGWLDDEVMNSIVALVNHRDGCYRATFTNAKPPSEEKDDEGETSDSASSMSPPRTYMFSTFFFSRLVERGGVYDYQGVRNWRLKGNLLLDAFDLSMVPIFLDGCHWVLAVINVSSRKFLFYDPMFSSVHGLFVPGLRSWLQDEVTARLGADVAAEWQIAAWPVLTGNRLSRQQDGSSCDVFVLAVADCIAAGTRASFKQEDIDVLRQRLALALYSDDLTIGQLPESSS